MKLTTANLKQIIKEELEAVMQEDMETEAAQNFFYSEKESMERQMQKAKEMKDRYFEKTLKQQADALYRKKQGTNMPFGDYKPDSKGAGQKSVYGENHEFSEEEKGLILQLLEDLEELRQRLGDEADVYEAIAQAGEKFYKGKGAQKVMNDVAFVRVKADQGYVSKAESQNEYVEMGNRFGKVRFSINAAFDVLNSQKKPGFFSRLRSKLPFEE